MGTWVFIDNLRESIADETDCRGGVSLLPSLKRKKWGNLSTIIGRILVILCSHLGSAVKIELLAQPTSEVVEVWEIMVLCYHYRNVQV